MRIKVAFTHNSQLVPYNYQYELARHLNKWLGQDNPWHGQSYNPMTFGSLGGLNGGKDGLAINASEVSWWVGAWQPEVLKALVKGVRLNPGGPLGFRVSSLQIIAEPNFGERTLFGAETPIVLKMKRESRPDRYVLFDDEDANEFLLSNLLHKLKAHQIDVNPEQVSIRFDRHCKSAKTKLIRIDGKGKDIRVKGSLCPVMLEAPEIVHRFVWAAGLGSSTGIGFGAVKRGFA